ncbi:hypothetical protein CRH03_25030 [Clostridium sp. HMb25]|nr:hypothetical protein CRH03_25030 [Clostridium sp. HMb25]
METIDEYRSLREEIITATNLEKGYEAIMYTVTVAIITYSFSKSEPLLFLIPTLVILPLFFLGINQSLSVLKVGMYIKVFYENEEPMWETRLLKYDEKHYSKKLGANPYLLMSFCGPIICIIQTIGELCVINIVKIILAVFCIVICSIVIIRNRVDNLNAKIKYIQYWNEIKEEEHKKQKSQ